jgi:hypothetical protein
MRKLAGGASLFAALGSDDVATTVQSDLERYGVTVHAARRDRPHRGCFTHLDAHGERTITVIGDRIVPRGDDPLPWTSSPTTTPSTSPSPTRASSTTSRACAAVRAPSSAPRAPTGASTR